MNRKFNKAVRNLAGALVLAAAVFGAVDGVAATAHSPAAVTHTASNDPSPTVSTAL